MQYIYFNLKSHIYFNTPNKFPYKLWCSVFSKPAPKDPHYSSGDLIVATQCVPAHIRIKQRRGPVGRIFILFLTQKILCGLVFSLTQADVYQSTR